MTPAELLTAFETFANAPEGIQRLRELVLTLAVRGKLVRQHEGDEPADSILDIVAAEKRRLSDSGQLRPGEPPQRYDSERLGYELPRGWVATCALGLGIVNPRNTAADSAQAAFAPMTLIPIDYREPLKPEAAKWGEIKKGYTHFANGDIAVAKITPCFENGKSCVMEKLPGGIGAGTTELNVLRPLAKAVAPRYLLIFFKSPGFIAGGISTMSGTAGQQRVSGDYFALSPIPLPPLREQHRIASKVDELMALIDKLEAASSAREQARIALRDSAFAAFRQAKNHADVLTAWKRVSENIGSLLLTKADVAAFRQVIWQLGSTGSLAAPVNEGVSGPTLLQELDDARLSAEKSRARHKEFSPTPITTDETPFVLPEGWAWARMAQVFQFIDYRGRTPKKQKSGIRLITAKNVRNGFVRTKPEEYISAADYPKWMTRGFPQRGDLLFTTEAPLGNVARLLIPGKIALAQRIINLHPYSPKLDSGFLEMVLLSPAVQSLINSLATGMTAKGIKASKLKNVPIPIAPPSEQQQIVCIVDKLKVLCDELEQALIKDLASHAAFAAAASHRLTT